MLEQEHKNNIPWYLIRAIQRFHPRGRSAAAMQVYWNKRMWLKRKTEFEFGTLTWPPLHCFGTSIWLPLRHISHYSYS